VSEIHQFVPRFEPGATGGAVVEIRAALRSAGHRSEIYATEIDDRFAYHGARPERDFDSGAEQGGGPRATIVYHLAIGAAMADRLPGAPHRLVVLYHNLTPASFLEPWDPELGPAVSWGRQQLRALARRAELAIAMSAYSEEDLRAAGYRATTNIPLPFDLTALASPDPSVLATLRSDHSGADWLFASRLAPNKAHHDLIAAFALFRQVHDPNARLWIAGGASSARYEAALRGYVEALGLDRAVGFTGAVPASHLGAYYADADVFVCLSDHEGFGLPVLEAWSHSLPVVAFRAGAIPEVAGDAAVLLSDKSPATVAAAVARVAHDAALHEALVARGRQRLATVFEPTRTRERMVAALERVEAGTVDVLVRSSRS
jgi:glycosyltransferase involved in cell wall biosynthesis